MRTNSVKAKLAAGSTSYGAWLNFPGTFSARMMARQSFLDWLLIDMEHAPLNIQQMAETVATVADAHGAIPFVRIPTNSVEYYKWALDAGAYGIMIPMVNTRAEAEKAVDLCKYPPEGSRSVGGIFMPYAFDTDRTDYTENINREVMVIVQIESQQALDNIDEILSVPGVDVAFIGPNDLHYSLGLTPSNEGAEPEFVAAINKVLEAGQRHNIPIGILSTDGEAATMRAGQGFRFISATSDANSLRDGLTATKKQLTIDD